MWRRREGREVKRHYTTPGLPGSFGGVKAVSDQFPHLKQRELREHLSDVDAYTTHGAVRRPSRYNPTYVRSKGELVQIDLLDLSQLYRTNRNYRYYLVFCDVFTRLASVRPLKSKRPDEVAAAFEELLEAFPGEVQRVQSDGGREFLGAFEELLREKGIEHTVTVFRHAHVVERLQRSLKSWLAKAMKEAETTVHLGLMERIVDGYNRRRHRIIKMSPLQAAEDRNAPAVLFNQTEEWTKRERFRKPEDLLKRHQLVRVRRSRHAFSRSFHQTFGSELHMISRVLDNLPVVRYRVENLVGEEFPGSLYREELAPVSDLLSSPFKIQRILWATRRPHPDDPNEELVDVVFTSLPPALAKRSLNVSQLAELTRAQAAPWGSRGRRY